MSSWPAARMLTTKPPARCRSSCIAASRAIETPTSGGSSESETSEPMVSPSRSPSRATVTTATPAGNRRMSAVSASPVMETESRSVDLVAELAALGQLLLELVRLLLREDVEHRQGRRGAPADVRSDARAHRNRAVHVAGAQEVLSALRGIGMAGLALPRFGQTCHTYAPEGTKHFLSAGDMYRAVAMGPGVTPDVGWGPAPALTVFDIFAEQKANELQKKLSKG